MSIRIYDDNTLVILVTVTDTTAGGAKNLTGATVTASAVNRAGTSAAADIAITDATAGTFSATFTAGELSTGRWRFQARVAVSGESQVVAEDVIRVEQAIV